MATDAGERLAELAESFVGCSLYKHKDELAALVTTCTEDKPGEYVRDNPAVQVAIRTNCAMFVRGLMKRLGVHHPLLEQPYRNGMAVGDVRAVAMRHGALFPFEGQDIPRGSILRYNTAGKNNDHVEVLLEDAGADHGWVHLHCGGGRTDNAITQEKNDIRWSWGRPLVEVVDPGLLLEPI